MAIAAYRPDLTPPNIPNTPTIAPEDYQGVVYDVRNVPIHSLIAYVSGAPWAVNYYAQVVGAHNDLREIDPGQANVYQQYQLVKGLEIRVSDALNTGYDSDTGLTTSTGAGIIYPFIVPNVNDYFTTDTGDNRVGIFKITQVDRKTFNRDSAYAVDYEMIGYTASLAQLHDDLVSKVIRTYHFSKDRLIEGLQPYLNDDVHQQVINLKYMYKDLVAYYFKTFFNRKYMTLVLPGQDHGVYDAFVVQYLLRMVEGFDAYEMQLIKQIPTDQDVYLSQPQFWQLMIERDYDGLLYCNKRMALVSKYLFNNNSYLQGLSYSNVEYIVYPDTPDTTTIVNNPQPKQLSIETLTEVPSVTGTLADMIDERYIEANTSYLIIHPVTIDNLYVLSNDFYTNTSGQSLLEVLTKDYLRGQTLDLNKLTILVDRFKTWGRLEQYYYGPIILTLLKEADRSNY